MSRRIIDRITSIHESEEAFELYNKLNLYCLEHADEMTVIGIEAPNSKYVLYWQNYDLDYSEQITGFWLASITTTKYDRRNTAETFPDVVHLNFTTKLSNRNILDYNTIITDKDLILYDDMFFPLDSSENIMLLNNRLTVDINMDKV